MRFKYENPFYSIAFDGTILKYTRKPLLRWLVLNPFGQRQTEFPVTEISHCETKSRLIFKTYRLELARWNTAKEAMSHTKLGAMYLLGWNKAITSALTKMIDHETSLDKQRQTWFLPRDYSRMAG